MLSAGQEITRLASCLGYEREVVRIWFCNRRQALKNTVRLRTASGGAAGLLSVPQKAV